MRVGSGLGCVKLDMRLTVVGSCALDGEGCCIRRGGAEHGRARVGVANITWPIQDRTRDSESEIKRVLNKHCN